MDDENKKPDDSYGHSFGQDNHAEQESAPSADRDPSAGYLRESVPYTFGPIVSQPVYRPGNDISAEDRSPTDVVPASREYRPFSVSGNGQGGSWQSPPRRSPFRAMFASFLAGVIVVGGLMFAADRGNWFTNNTVEAAPFSQSASVRTASNPVSNAVDVVRPNNIAQIFQQASPAVVKIETYVNASANGTGSMDPFFSQFFGDGTGNGGNTGNGGGLQPNGMGSGFIFDSTGYILTNQHVIAGANDIEVTVAGHNKPLKAKLLGSDFKLDLAVLKIEGSGFPTLKLGDSTASNMGDWVVAIGNPYGFDHTVTVGVLSANERDIQIPDQNGTRNYQHLLQTDASINPGNSGGPLLNLNGEVIGINTAVSAQAQGIGFAIPTSTISQVLSTLKSNVKIPQPYIGASLMSMTPQIAQKLGVTVTEGALVRDVIYGSPAYQSDLRAYDIISGIDGNPIKDNSVLVAAISKKKVGDKVTLNVVRGDKKVDIVVQIGDKNTASASQLQ
jgi:serine protease Do